MNNTAKKILSPAEIANISSRYLSEGRKEDVWEITHVEICGESLTAKVRMVSYYVSPTDDVGFHLTSFSTLEFLSQLFIIYGHVLGGLTKKTREGWMLESSISCKKAIRDPENIAVEMNFRTLKQMRESLIGVANARVYDQDGLFLARIKAILA